MLSETIKRVDRRTDPIPASPDNQPQLTSQRTGTVYANASRTRPESYTLSHARWSESPGRTVAGMTRVAVGMIIHETNTFSSIPTTLASFAEERIGILEGDEVTRRLAGTKTGIGGFLDVARETGWQVIGTVAASATPSASVAAEAHDDLKGRLLRQIQAAGQLDAVLLHLHGAMVSENAPDAEGDICRAVRELVGPDIPVIVELDLHGNITAAFCRDVDGVFGYDTNPHIDAYERGVEAAQCLARILNGTLPRPTVSITRPPMLPPTINMRTTEGPMHTLLAQAREWENQEGIVNVSVFGGFPFADFPEAGSSIIVTATDPAEGQRCADDLASYAWEIRDEFLKSIPPVPEAVEQALALVRQGGDGPVILADVADNPGGGGSGDTTALLRELVRRQATGAATCIWDPETVKQAMRLGVDAEGTFQIGGKSGADKYGGPLEVQGRVALLSDGRFTGWGAMFRGAAANCGPTARIDVGGLKLIVVSIRQATNDRGYFHLGGVRPEFEPLLVVKSRGHFRADFEPIARAIIEVDAPGAANPNLERFDFQQVRRPIWPLDRDLSWDGPDPIGTH